MEGRGFAARDKETSEISASTVGKRVIRKGYGPYTGARELMACTPRIKCFREDDNDNIGEGSCVSVKPSRVVRNYV